MKKIILILILGVVLAAGLSLYIYSYARARAILPMPEAMNGQPSSAFWPEKIEDETVDPGRLKASGAVWLSPEKEKE